MSEGILTYRSPVGHITDIFLVLNMVFRKKDGNVIKPFQTLYVTGGTVGLFGYYKDFFQICFSL